MLKNFSKGLLFGSILGGTLGILFAPKSGRQTRQGLVDEVDDSTRIVNDLQASLNRFNHSLAHLKQTAGETIPAFQKDITTSVENFKFQAQPRLKEIEKTTEQIKKDLG